MNKSATPVEELAYEQAFQELEEVIGALEGLNMQFPAAEPDLDKIVIE